MFRITVRIGTVYVEWSPKLLVRYKGVFILIQNSIQILSKRDSTRDKGRLVLLRTYPIHEWSITSLLFLYENLLKSQRFECRDWYSLRIIFMYYFT